MDLEKIRKFIQEIKMEGELIIPMGFDWLIMRLNDLEKLLNE